MGNSEETLLTHEVITEWGPYHVECGPYHMVYKALHENDCNVETERSLCDFSPRKPYNCALFGTFNYIPEKKNEKNGKRKGSWILNTCVGTVLL